MNNIACQESIRQLKCLVIIPTYNNAGTIGQVIDDVKQYSKDILVVNDGSTDNTSVILSRYNDIYCIDYMPNRGKGYALEKGLKWAINKGYDYAITMDADGQHYADDIPTFIEYIEKYPGSLLIGARNLNAENMPGKNTFANKFSNFWYKVETGQTLQDTQSGYRLYPLQSIKGIKLLSGRYEFEVEIIVRSAWKGISVKNIPIKVYYPPEEERVSHFRPLRDFTRISILNTVLVLYAFLFYYPWRFIKSLNRKNIKKFLDDNILHSKESNLKLSIAIGWGIFCAIIPIWGYQMIFSLITAHFLKLNKIIVGAFSNVSFPPVIPFILYGSLWCGNLILYHKIHLPLNNITFSIIYKYLLQYIIGSIVLAIVAGLISCLIAYIILYITRKERINA